MGYHHRDEVSAMTDDALLWNHEPPRLSQPRPREHLWTMRKPNGRVIEAVLLNQGDYGTEAQFFLDGQFYQSRRWPTKAEAVADAEEKRATLQAEVPNRTALPVQDAPA